MADSNHGWIGYFGDRHGRPAADRNDHLSAEQREELTRRAEERARQRGRLQAVVVVDVYESGEAVPQVQFPETSTIGPSDRTQINDAVARATEALRDWR